MFHDQKVFTISGILKRHHETLFTPKLPQPLVEAIQEISFGTIDRIKLDFEEPFWDLNNPGIMFLWNEENEDSVEVNRKNWFKFVFGFDEILNHPSTLMGWISGKAARYFLKWYKMLNQVKLKPMICRFMETLSDDDIAQDLCSQLQSIISKYRNDPNWQLPKLKQTVVTRWYTNSNFKGVYSYRNQSCDLKGITNKDLSTPIYVNGYPRILFAGEATDTDHYGTVHGAMGSGVREVDRLEAFWKNNP